MSHPYRPKTGLAVRALALATSSLAWPVSAPAQEVRLAPITVTATSNPVEAFIFPGQVSIVERETIEAVMPSTVEETLRSVPGVDFDGGPRRTEQVPSIRGLDGPDVVILFDGVRQSFNPAVTAGSSSTPSSCAASRW